MTNVIVREGVAVYITDDNVELPTPPAMIEIRPCGCDDVIRIGAGDVNIHNSVVYENVTLPEDYEDGRFEYDGINWSLIENV